MMGHDEDDSPGVRTGRFTLPHRGNTRVEVGEPIRVPDPGASRPWLCVVKLVGHDEEAMSRRGGSEEDDMEATGTSTLLVRTGRGTTPEEAQRDAVAQLSLLYGTPAGPPPSVVITKKPSEPPPRNEAKKPGPFAWLGKLFGLGKS
jgi:hypothetical protein